MLHATDDLPLNFGFSGKGNTFKPDASLESVLRGGADILKIGGEPYVLPSSTNPTRPFTRNTIDEVRTLLFRYKYYPFSMFANTNFVPHTIAPRHAHGVPSPGPVHPGGRGIHQEPDSSGDYCGQGNHAQ